MAEDKPQQQTPAPAPPPAVPTNPAVIMATQPPPDWQVNPSLPNIQYDLGAISPSLRSPPQPYGPPSPSVEFQAYAPSDRFTPALPNLGDNGGVSVDFGDGAATVNGDGLTLNTPWGPVVAGTNGRKLTLTIRR